MSSDIIFTREKQIGLITLNRPAALNALNLDMIKSLQQQLILWQNDPDIHAVVLRAEEGKAFCAGGDVRWLYEAGLAKDPQQMQFFWHEYRLNHFISQFNKPYIVLMNGITMGGGVGISLHGSHPVATEKFVFAMPETGIGFFPDIGASYLLARCPGHTGVYLGLSGNRLQAADALELGLVHCIIDSEKLPMLLASLIEADLSVDAKARVDQCLGEFAKSVQAGPVKSEMAMINESFAADKMEDILSALQARSDDWSKALLQNLQQKSPLSLKVSLAQIRKAASMTLAECLQMDYCLAGHFMQDVDFYEGIRALLVDKDKNPHWQPESLDLVTAEKIDSYFSGNLPFLIT